MTKPADEWLSSHYEVYGLGQLGISFPLRLISAFSCYSVCTLSSASPDIAQSMSTTNSNAFYGAHLQPEGLLPVHKEPMRPCKFGTLRRDSLKMH